MNRVIVVLSLSFASLAAGAADAPSAPPRVEMNVTQGPETVFSRAPADLFPALAGAQRTREAGRVGNEMVFWGYRQRDGARVFLFACWPVAGVDCEQRIAAVCPNVKVLQTQTASGTTVRRSCRPIALTGPGETRPGCEDREEMPPLSIGLLSCG
ncbi:MAG TPA: hypothetical protein VHH11_08125 [Gammaproteobacteria bacterium]|jgi:hypothetical protein|nr:hypothetical protein [Gammaproteobacteria bacterium]